MSVDLSSLIKSLQSEQASQRQTAAQQLLQLGPEAAPAAVALVEACDTDAGTRDLATAALEDLGKPNDDAAEPLAVILKRSTLDAPYWAATLLGRLEGAGAPGVKDLMGAATKHPHGAARQRAVWALGRIGRPAEAALSVLQGLLDDSDPRLSSLARDAVASIRS